MRVILKSTDGFGSLILTTTVGDSVNNNCLISTRDFCFICIQKLVNDEGTPPPPPQSMNFLESHLGINFKNWLAESGLISEKTSGHPFLQKLTEKGVNYQAHLCSDCACAAEILSASCGQSAESREEHDVTVAIRTIQNRMEESDKSERMTEFYKETMTKPGPETIRIAAVTSIGRMLRRGIFENCKAYYVEKQQRKMVGKGKQPGNDAMINDNGEVEQGNMTSTVDSSSSHALETHSIYDHQFGIGTQPTSAPSCPCDSEPTNVRTPEQVAIPLALNLELELSDSEICGLPVFNEDELIAALEGNQMNASKSPSLESESVGPLGRRHRIKPTPSTSASPAQTIPNRSNFSLIAKLKGELTYAKQECIFCSETFSTMSQLDAHLRRHTKEALYFCNLCDSTSYTRSNLNKHLKLHQKSRRRTFRCEVCPMKFFEVGSLYMHQKIHDDKHWFKCDSCPKTFKTKWSLKMHHARKHFKGAKVKCELCGKGFGHSSFLPKHLKESHGKSYSCNICKTVCSTKHGLKRHKLRVHNSKLERPFSCDICAKQFPVKRELQVHMERHANNAEGRRPHKCETCRKGFVTRNDLATHKRKVHSKK